MENRLVIIIGAGLSGLTAAYRLMQKGIDVQVYEARQRVGGRVLTARLNDTVVELGGQNILDGGKAENLQRLAVDLNLTTERGAINSRFHYFEGTKLIDIDKLLSQSQVLPPANKLKQHLNEIARDSQNMAQVLHALFASHPDLYKLFAIRLMGYEGLSVEKLSTCYVETLADMLLRFSQSDEDGYRYYEYMIVQGGNSRLVEKLQEKLDNRIHLGMPLRFLGKSPNGTYVLSFENSHTIETERVVLAIPCGVYKDILFYPDEVLQSRLEDIKAVAYGEHAKLLVPLNIPANCYGLYANDRFGTFSMATPNIVTMYYLNHNVSFGPANITEVFQSDASFLETVYQANSLSQMQAVYALDEQDAHYQGPVGYNWFCDPYARGSYSCTAVGQEEVFNATIGYKGEMVKTLFLPIDHRFFFAGEHTSLISEIGTMEAAVEAGERTARMIAYN